MIEIFILSLIQGITEFLPISSSSHLILSSEYLNFKNQNLSIDVSLHIGSFIAVIFYFYKDIINFYENKILFFKIFISAIPIMIVGFFLVESGFAEKIRNIEIKPKYIVQLKDSVPTFKVFINSKSKAPEIFRKYFDNAFRKFFKLDGIPIIYKFMSSKNPYSR